MILWVFLLLCSSEEGPYLPNNIDGPYNDWIFSPGSPCSGGQIVDMYYCVCPENRVYEAGNCAEACSGTNVEFGGICVDQEALAEMQQQFPAAGSMQFYDIIVGSSESRNVQMTPEVQENLKNAAVLCKGRS